MPSYIVDIGGGSSLTLKNGVDRLVIEAADAAEAREMAESTYDGDMDALWSVATVTEVTNDTDFEGWTFNVVITPPTGVDLYNVSYEGVAADTLDLVGAALEALLDTAGLTATYTAATQLLEIAAIGDNVGDHTVNMYVVPPNGFRPGVSTMEASKVHEGIAAAVLSVTFVADTPAIPLVAGQFKS